MTDVCVALIPRPDLAAAYRAARVGQPDQLDELGDGIFGALAGLLESSIAAVQTLGPALPVLARAEDGSVQVVDADGEPEPVVLRWVPNPATWSTIELAKLLGYTGAEHLHTPRAQLKAQRRKSDPRSHLKRLAELRERTLPKRRRRRRR